MFETFLNRFLQELSADASAITATILATVDENTQAKVLTTSIFKYRYQEQIDIGVTQT